MCDTGHGKWCVLNSEQSGPHRRAIQIKVLIVVRDKGYSSRVKAYCDIGEGDGNPGGSGLS